MKIQLPEQSLREILGLYKPEQRLLREASIEYPTIRGTFLIGQTYYTFSPLQHATDIEIQLCLNQLAYAGMYEGIRLGLDSSLKGINFRELQKEGMLIIESRKKFRRQIPTDREIIGSIKLKDRIERDGISLCDASFQFENKSCFGRLTLALLTKQPQGDRQ